MAHEAAKPHAEEQPEIEHLVAQPEDGGRLVIIGLDARCRPVYLTTLYSYL